MKFALGLMAVAVGSHLNFKRLRPARRRLTYLLLLDGTLTPALVFCGVIGKPLRFSMVLRRTAQVLPIQAGRPPSCSVFG